MWGDLTDRFIKTETESGFEDKEEEKSQEIKTESDINRSGSIKRN